MLLWAAQVVRFLTYVGSLAGEFGLLGSGAPMNLTPRPVRHAWNEVMAVKNWVRELCFASGTVVPEPPDPPLDPEPLGSWILTWPLLIVDAGIQPLDQTVRAGSRPEALADPRRIADAVLFLANQDARAATHELQLTPLAENWTP